MPEKVSIVPSPRILIAIAQNPMQPVQALAELIDNGVDAYTIAKKQGTPVEKRTISVTIPKKKDVDEGGGELVVEDKGPGMTLEQATKAITAGYSDKANPDLLGLFGMGFNIATAKIGQFTTLSTARKQDKKMTNLTIDLQKMTQSQDFFAVVSESDKPSPDYSGTIVRVSGWWSQGSQNFGFVKKLANLSKKDLRDKIGRIYYPIINQGIEIFVDGESCKPYRHCVWGPERYVTRKDGRVPAQMPFDTVLKIEYKCSNPECKNVLMEKKESCPVCNSKLIPFEHRIHGWIGIQRFDDLNDYGIDLIRNGRVIRHFEQDGFFKFTDESGNEKKEYPADSVTGRIVGEVHVDHVPVNYLKTDFERSTAEWSEMVSFIRGDTSLWPEHESNRTETNSSPLYRLFQGYRRIRTVGTKDMYMGRWNAGEDKARRLTREEEQGLYQKFLDGEPGYLDDTKWWEFVLQADQPPTEATTDCPDCGFQNSVAAEKCGDCGKILIGKKCINNECGKDIPKSAELCDNCNTRQVIEEQKVWKCLSCGKNNNPPSAIKCLKCGILKGDKDSLSIESLLEKSGKVEELSDDSFTLPLPGDMSMPSLKIATFYVNHPLTRNNARLPLISYMHNSVLHIFIDKTHPGIQLYQNRPEDYVAMEIARWINARHGNAASEFDLPLLSISNLFYQVHKNLWEDRIVFDSEEIKRRVSRFLNDLQNKLPELLSEHAEWLYKEYFDATEQGRVVMELAGNRVDTSKMDEFITTGEYLKYLPDDLILKVFEKFPGKFFDGTFWNDQYTNLPIADAKLLEDMQQDRMRQYSVCLTDIINYKKARNPDPSYAKKIDYTLKMLEDYISD